MQLYLLPNAIFYFLTSGTWHSFGLGECWSSFCPHFSLNILHIEHMFCYLLASFLPYSSPFSSRYGHILIYASYVLFCIISRFSCLNSIICSDILMYEFVYANHGIQRTNEKYGIHIRYVQSISSTLSSSPFKPLSQPCIAVN